ncbi:UDP-N-acetylmuramoyl-tripeptide--D-alanyl-D-alanine ligase [Victivallis sp. Marseille-Q1083]|uniref:UDP-N-acetylmuramoyl-tripeptide--D-alanyl-D- alanine ligase n=1 Tax=Victivallis sp. Marseille-Q1083 TaxID=2717288 RepID=UPI00158D7D47|nr:UDP-N-acetylmuramoyl-tripeptide--D-alanyl-D-alanine ligase [Victivallis sp. Marseille-Q1083]
MTGPGFTAAELAAFTGGEWRFLPPSGDLTVSGVATDSRRDCRGRLFAALAGERFDAHDFLPAAIAAGCAALLIDRTAIGKLPVPCPCPVLLTADTLAAYQAIAAGHRNRFPSLLVAAVTGSVGKTSVKEMLRSIFAAVYGAEQVLYTLGNTNNQIGVPQNLLRLHAGIRCAIIEMGTSAPGEIAPLSRTASPNAALVNAIAPCHLEKLHSLDGVAAEKADIFTALRPDGLAVIPAQSPGETILRAAAAPFRTVKFGPGGDVQATYLGGNLSGSRIELSFADGTILPVDWHLSGRHQAMNAAAAAALAAGLGIPPAAIADGLRHCELPGMRMEISRRDGNVYVNDAYNANPGSMIAALEHLAEFIHPEEWLLVLGDMLELGTYEEREHRAVLDALTRLLPTVRAILVGPRFRAALPAASPFLHTAADAEAARVLLRQLRREGDFIFLKGSRGIHLENIMPTTL